MPIYEYQCQECGHIIEVLNGVPASKKCGRCTGIIQKIISQGTFQLKGPGWYSDGYSKCARNKNKKIKNR